MMGTTEATSRDDDEHAVRRGRHARSPRQIPWSGWKSVLKRTFQQMISDRISLSAAGCAFYATLALFPAITMLIFMYGLVFDPVTVEPQLQVLRELLPDSAYQLIDDRIRQLVSQKQDTLTIGLLVSVAITLWSSATGTKSILSALNLAYGETERRSFLRFQLTALGMTLCAVLLAVLAIAILVFLPAAFSFLGISFYAKQMIRAASMLLLVFFVLLSLSLLYRFGPSRKAAQWSWVTTGSLVATLLWILASALLSYYISHIASYNVTYGPLGAVVGVMTWFYVTVYVVLLGAELNSELEMQTAQDSTLGPPKPMGQRGAYVADNVAPD
jgi:membrane protein